ncbi:3-methyladenine DNA glycosylase [Pseudocyphellaria aurata]|nr:3-methyladenine DNA glycosylase [Pseudocyphellaria aurata]
MSTKRGLRSSLKALCESPQTQVTSNSDDISGRLRSRQISVKTRKNKADNGAASRGESPSAPVKKKAMLMSPSRPSELNFQGDAFQNSNEPNQPPTDRPAEPHMTNAPLRTPRGSRLVAYSKKTAESSPAKSGIPRATATTGSLLGQACDHLIQIDSRFKHLIEKHPCPIFSAEGLAEEIDPFQSLCSGIISQQVSGAAATSIKKKFVGLFLSEAVKQELKMSKGFPQPLEVAGSDIPFLRQAGLSQRKAEYIKGLAEKFVDGELSAKMLIMASDEEVLERLTAVRGLGKWSVEMFACFSLKRMDVFSTGDLGVQYGSYPQSRARERLIVIRRGMAAWLGKDVKKIKAKGGGKWKYMTEQEMLEIAAKFSPYR